MRYNEVKPTGFLKNFVQCFWEYDSENTQIEHTILPDGYFDLITTFHDDLISSLSLTGAWKSPINISIPKHTKFFAIRFKLLATEYLFQHEIKSILDTSKSLPLDFWNINSFNSTQFEKFVLELTEKLNHSIKHLKKIDTRKLKLFDLVYQNKLNTVAEIANTVAWSSRQINRYFNNQFGFSLKEFIKIIRCKSSYKDISDGNLFPQKDYYDQAHFIKDVKKYTGATPKELHKNDNDRFLQLSKTKRE